jgi:hypothetical protein
MITIELAKDYCKILADAGVPMRDKHKCMRWALGDGWGYLGEKTCNAEFNNLHPELPKIELSSKMSEALRTIAGYWLKEAA